MSFRSLSAQRYDQPETNVFRISVEKRGVSFKLPVSGATKLGWVAGMKLDVQVGEGEDAGTIRLCADPKGWSLNAAGSKTKGLRMVVKAATGLGAPDVLPSTPVRHELIDDAIIAWLPWAKSAPIPAPIAPAPEMTIIGKLPVAPKPSEEPKSTPFPVQTQSLADVRETVVDPPSKRPQDRFALKSGAHPSEWPADKKRRFIDAVLEGKGDTFLSKIAERPVGSIWNIRNNTLKAEIDAARVARGAKASPAQPFKTAIPPKSPPPAVTRVTEPVRMVPREVEPEPKPTLTPELLKFLRDEVAPVFLPFGRKVTKNHNDTGLLLDGAPMTLEAIVAEANRLLRLAGDPAITFEAAA